MPEVKLIRDELINRIRYEQAKAVHKATSLPLLSHDPIDGANHIGADISWSITVLHDNRQQLLFESDQ